LSLFRKDSLDLEPKDRTVIRDVIARDDGRHFVVTHGTDTIIETARSVRGIPGKTIVLTGAMQPAAFRGTDATFNIGFAMAAAQLLNPGVYVTMNGRVFEPNNVRKNPLRQCFETRTSGFTTVKRWPINSGRARIQAVNVPQKLETEVVRGDAIHAQFDLPQTDTGPEMIVRLFDPADGVTWGFVAVDNLVMGPSLGGVRLAPDVSLQEIYGLARAMTFKNAAAMLPIGGGKSGLVGSPRYYRDHQDDKQRLITAFAEAIWPIKEYIPGPDMGTDEHDMQLIYDVYTRLNGAPDLPCDILVPAARPDAVTDANKDSIQCRFVLQGANNRVHPSIEAYLTNSRGITCLTDFIVNAGGVIACAVELKMHADPTYRAYVLKEDGCGRAYMEKLVYRIIGTNVEEICSRLVANAELAWRDAAAEVARARLARGPEATRDSLML